MYAVANELTSEGIEAVSRFAFMEMAEAGVTQVGEFHYLHHNPDGARYDDPDELARPVMLAGISNHLSDEWPAMTPVWNGPITPQFRLHSTYYQYQALLRDGGASPDTGACDQLW